MRRPYESREKTDEKEQNEGRQTRICRRYAGGTDGRTALDAANTLTYESVVKFLVEKGARPGATKK